MNKGYIFNIQKFCLHDGKGIRTDIFFCGCNLRCKWCCNPESWDISGEHACGAAAYTVDEVVKEVLKDKPFYDKSGGGATLTGGEVFCQQEFAEELCAKLRTERINIALETSGYTERENFKNLIRLVDFVFIDCKHYDDAVHKEGTGVSNARILDNIKYLAESGRDYCVRIPVIPNYNDSEKDALSFADLFQKTGVKAVQLLPFHQLGEKKYADMKIPYLYKGFSQLHKEDLVGYAKILSDKDIRVTIGGTL